jgi:hypothetical protein
MDRNLWPLNPNSMKVDSPIDWDAVHPTTIRNALPSHFKEISRKDLLVLMNKALSEEIPKNCLPVVQAIIEFRKPELTKKKTTPVKERITEDMILETMEEALDKAKEDQDQAMVFKFSECLARYKSLFKQDVEQGDIIINVVTGVPVPERKWEK